MSSILKPVLGSQLNLGHRFSQNLAGLWLMNENAGGKVLDLSGHGNTGIITNATWAAGKFGPALDFDGTGDYVNCGDKTTLQLIGPMAYSVWFKTSSNANSYILGKYNHNIGTPAHCGYIAYVVGTSAGEVRIIFRYGGLDYWFYDTTTTGWNDGQFHHLFVSYPADGIAPSIYIDSILQSMTIFVAGGDALSGIRDPDTDLLLGASTKHEDGNPLGYFTGQIDTPLFLNRALSASEVAQLYREPFAMFERDPIELWVGATSVGVPPVGMAGAMTTNTGYWGW